MAFFALLAAVILGWLDWSGWWSIPVGIGMFIGGMRALPQESGRMNAVGIPLYILGALIIMKLSGWVGSLFA